MLILMLLWKRSAEMEIVVASIVTIAVGSSYFLHYFLVFFINWVC